MGSGKGNCGSPLDPQTELEPLRRLAGSSFRRREIADKYFDGRSERTVRRYLNGANFPDSQRGALKRLFRDEAHEIGSSPQSNRSHGDPISDRECPRDIFVPKSIDEACEAVIASQQPNRSASLIAAFSGLSTYYADGSHDHVNRSLIAILLAQLAILDGAANPGKLAFCFGPLERVIAHPRTDATERGLASMAATCKGRIHMLLAPLHRRRKDRIAQLNLALASFEQADHLWNFHKPLCSIDKLPIVWSHSEYAQAEIAPSDAVHRTKLTRMVGPTHRYKMWARIALAGEHLLAKQNEVDLQSAERSLERASEDHKSWSKVVSDSSDPDLHGRLPTWSIRLHGMDRLLHQMRRRNGGAIKADVIRDSGHRLESALADSDKALTLWESEKCAAAALLNGKIEDIMPHITLDSEFRGNESSGSFGVDICDMLLCPLNRLFELNTRDASLNDILAKRGYNFWS